MNNHFLIQWFEVGTARITTPDTTYKQNILRCRITTSTHMNTHILIQWFSLETHELPHDDQLLIETCRSAFKCFSEWNFKLMFYYVELQLLAHYIQGTMEWLGWCLMKSLVGTFFKLYFSLVKNLLQFCLINNVTSFFSSSPNPHRGSGAHRSCRMCLLTVLISFYNNTDVSLLKPTFIFFMTQQP
jgi:hypothetical protein